MAHATDLPPSFDDFLVPLKSSLDFDACSLTAGTPLPHTGHPAAGAAADGAAKVSTTPPHPDPGSSATTLHVATPASLYPSPSAITAAAAAAAATIAAVKRSGHTRAPTVLPTPMLTNTRSDRRSRQPSNAITAAPAVDLPVDRDATWPHSDGGSGSGATSLMSLCWSTTHDDLLMPDYMAPEAPAWLKGVHDVNDDEDRPTPALPTCTSHRRRRYRRSADHVLPQPQPPPRPSPPQQHTRQPSPQLKAPSHVTADATSAASADNATCSGTMERSVSVSSGATLDLNLYLNIASSPAALSAPLSTPPGASAADAAALADAAAAAAALAATACANRLDDAHPSLTKAATLSSLLANALLPRQASSGLPVLSAPGPHAAPGTPGTAALSDFLPPEPSQIPEHQARPPALLPQPLGVAMVPPDIDWVRALADISSSAQSAFMSSSATTLSAADPFRPAGAPSTLAPPEHAAAAAAVAELLWSMDKENDDPFGPITTDPNGKALAEHPFPSTAARAARKRPFHALDSTSTEYAPPRASLPQLTAADLSGMRDDALVPAVHASALTLAQASGPQSLAAVPVPVSQGNLMWPWPTSPCLLHADDLAHALDSAQRATQRLSNRSSATSTAGVAAGPSATDVLVMLESPDLVSSISNGSLLSTAQPSSSTKRSAKKAAASTMTAHGSNRLLESTAVDTSADHLAEGTWIWTWFGVYVRVRDPATMQLGWAMFDDGPHAAGINGLRSVATPARCPFVVPDGMQLDLRGQNRNQTHSQNPHAVQASNAQSGTALRSVASRSAARRQGAVTPSAGTAASRVTSTSMPAAAPLSLAHATRRRSQIQKGSSELVPGGALRFTDLATGGDRFSLHGTSPPRGHANPPS